MKPLRILMLGFGNVGRRLVSILSLEQNKYLKLKDFNGRFIGIFTKRHGYRIEDQGIDLVELLASWDDRALISDLPNHSESQFIEDAVKNLDYDVLVELTTLSIGKRGEPAIGFVKQALRRGKNVVTANKGPAAFDYKEISKLAQKNQGLFLGESAVMDGAPIFNMAKASLKGARVTGFSGILNSTTNFVLAQMEQGISMSDAVKIAQQRGFAEADPSYDLDGWDAAAKIAVLANMLMDATMTPFDVKRDSITSLNPAFVKQKFEENKRLKLVCSARQNKDQIESSVQLQALPLDHPFACAKGSGSIIRLETDLMGPILIAQEAPTLNDTAYGVLNDLMTIAERN